MKIVHESRFGVAIRVVSCARRSLDDDYFTRAFFPYVLHRVVASESEIQFFFWSIAEEQRALRCPDGSELAFVLFLLDVFISCAPRAGREYLSEIPSIQIANH